MTTPTGNTKYWLRSNKLDIQYTEPTSQSGLKLYRYYSALSIDILDNSIIIPLEEVLKDYPELYGITGTIFSCNRKNKRTYNINNILK